MLGASSRIKPTEETSITMPLKRCPVCNGLGGHIAGCSTSSESLLNPSSQHQSTTPSISELAREERLKRGDAAQRTIHDDSEILPKDDSPFDKESLKLLFSLPQRSASTSSALSLMKILGIVLAASGGFVAFSIIKVWDKKDPTNPGPPILTFLASAGVLAVGGFLWITSDTYFFEKAPLGTLFRTLFEGISRRKFDKVRQICNSIIKQTDGKDTMALPILMLRALAFQVSAETSSDQKQGALQAEKARPLFQQVLNAGVKTPLIYFGLATTERICGQNGLAIDFYSQYLALCPNDSRTREIMEQCAGKE